MTGAATRRLLQAWEAALPLSPAGRGVALLAAASSESSSEALAELAVGRRDDALLALRESMFGSRVIAITSCPACGAAAEIEFDLDQIRVQPADAGGPEQRLDVDGWSVTFRLPTTADLIVLEGCDSEREARDLLLDGCILEARGEGRSAAGRELPPAVRAAVAAAMESADPQADVRLQLSCPDCGEGWRQAFDILSFLWSEIDAWARRLISEVHLLARSYGWSESEILSLSPGRRRAYLELVTG